MIIQFWYNCLDIVFFINGLASFSLAGIIYLQLRTIKYTEYAFSRILWLLAAFGLIHALASFINMFAWNRYGQFYFLPSTTAILTLAFIVIFIFGYRLVNICQKRTLGVLFLLLTAVAVLSLPLLIENSLFVWGTATHYFLGFVGELLAAAGFIRYYHCNREKIDEISAGKYFYAAAAFFALLAVAEGLIVPRAGFFPASIINTRTFLELTNIPVQVLRTLATLGIAWAVWHISDIFNAESAYNLMRQKRLLWQSETEAKNILDCIPLGVIVTTPEGGILNVNLTLRKIFGFEPDETYAGFNVVDFYADPNRRQEMLSRINFSGAVKNFEVELKRKDGRTFPAKLNSILRSDPDGEPEIISAIEDLSDQKPT